MSSLLSTIALCAPPSLLMLVLSFVGYGIAAPKVLIAALQHLADESGCELEARQSALLQWLPALSWNVDASTTSMHVLAQAARRVRQMEW